MDRKSKDIKIGLCGHFGGGHEFLDGQTVKTKSIYVALEKRYGKEAILIKDTYGGLKSLPNCLCSLIKMLHICDDIIILPAQNSVKIFPLFLVFFNKFYRKKIHYIVIGGWLPKMTSENRRLANILKRIDFLYVETSVMKKALEYQGFDNTIVLKNFKELRINKDVDVNFRKPYRICTFSRVTEQKGIEDIVDVVLEINSELQETSYQLDIYGQVDNEYQGRFTQLLKKLPETIKYKGCVDSSKSVEILKDYFMLVFPTKFYTEGIPGTIIDAYYAGIPVVSSRWESFGDIIEEGKTGYGYRFGNKGELKNLLLYILKEPEMILSLKNNCLSKSKEYHPDVAIKPLIERIENVD